jgi:hypothetical protein
MELIAQDFLMNKQINKSVFLIFMHRVLGSQQPTNFPQSPTKPFHFEK